MLRSIAKDAAARVASWTRLDSLARQSVHRAAPYVVGYHRVVDRLDAHGDLALPAMEVTVEMLDQHLDWLGRHFDIVSVEELPAKMNRHARSKPIAAVTFDDGYLDVFQHAFPLLKRKGIPAAFFVVTDLIETEQAPVHDRLYAALANVREDDPFAATQTILSSRDQHDVLAIIASLDADGEIARRTAAALRPLTWDALAQMRDAGMTIGSHSRTHAFLTNETAARVQQELRVSRVALQQRLGIAADCFAYPGGGFNATVVEAVRAAGYRLAFTDCRHRDERFPMLTIRRRGLWERSCVDRFGRFSPAIMSCHSAAMFDPLSSCIKSH